VGRGVELDEVHRATILDIFAIFAYSAWFRPVAILAVRSFCEESGERGFPGPARSGEKIGVAQFPASERVLERADDVFLTDDLGEGRWSIGTVESRHNRMKNGE
jgi:hypothetical protein